MKPLGVKTVADVAEQAGAEDQRKGSHTVKVLGKGVRSGCAARFLDVFLEQGTG